MTRRVSRIEGEDRELGIGASITRRDFLNASLIGAGGALRFGAPPVSRLQVPPDPWTGFGGVGDYARSNGNTWDVVTAAHDLRDGRYQSRLGSAVDTGERVDLIVVGGGLSGLGAAYRFRQLRGPRAKVLVLDNHAMWGGEAKRNELVVDGVRLIGPQGSNNFDTPPPNDWSGDYWRELGLPSQADEYAYQQWPAGVKPLEMARDNFAFQLWYDESTSHGLFLPDGRGGLDLVRDPFRAGLAQMPWPEPLRADFLRWRSDPTRYYPGADWERWLDGMTYEAYLTGVMKLDPKVARYVDPIMAAAIGLGSDVLSAYAAFQIGLPGFQGFGRRQSSRALVDVLALGTTFPGGNDGIARHVVKRLIPSAIRGGTSFAAILNGAVHFPSLDRPGQPTRIRLRATVVRVEPRGIGAGSDVVVTYARGGILYRVVAGAVVMANGAWTSRHVVADLSAAHRDAMASFVRAPILVANVALRQWRFMYDLGITAASYRDELGFSCNLRQSMVVGSYQPPLDPDRPNLLTFYIPFPRPGAPLREQAAVGRQRLLGTTWRDYERGIRRQMARLFGRAGFDPARDIRGLVLNRWGHAYVCPAPGFYFGAGGGPAPREVLRRPLGRIGFANAELTGHQSWISATAEGRRAVDQLMAEGA